MRPLFLLLLALATTTVIAADTERIQPLAIGAAAPDFTLPGVDGRDWSLKDFAASKLLAVVFTCNHCPTAQAYEERLKKVVQDFQEKGVAVESTTPSGSRW